MESDGEALEFIEEVTKNCDTVQERVLAEILSRNAYTEYLKRHRLEGKTDRHSFKNQIPVVKYEDILPDIQRIANGDFSPILSSEPISELISSSGTSGGEKKLIPMTEEERNRRQLFNSLLTHIMKFEKARNNASFNKSHHRTGQKGYIRKRHEWIDDGRLPPEAALTFSSSSSVNSSVTSTLARVKKFRSKEWILAHQVLNKDGEWEIDPNDKEIAEIAKKTMEYIEEEEKGNLVFEDQEDALTKAMGKKDHRGRVKAMGGNVCHTVAFGPRKRQNKFDHSEASSDVIESIRASMRKEFEDDLDKIVEKRVQETLQKQLAAMGHMGQYASTSNPVDDLHGHAEHDSAPQPHELKERVPCHLALEDEVSGNKVIVADGMVQPSDGALTQHFRLMKSGHYKVQIDFVYEGHVDDILPVPTGDGLTNLGGAQGSFVQWPIHLVIFEDDEEFTPRLIKKSKSKSLQSKSNKEVVGSCDRKTQESAAKSKKANFANDAIQGLGPQCKYLHFFISSAPGEIYDSTPIKLDASIWHYSQDQDTYVTESDVEEFLRGACLNISVIQLYILYLLHDHSWAFERSSQIGFLCPETMSSTRIKVDPNVPTEYLKMIFVAEIQKEKMNDPSITKWFLLRYNQENHWILYVLDLRKVIVYIFDPLKEARKEYDVWGILSLTYQVYKFNGGVRPSKTTNFKSWRPIHIECAQQSGGTECGYYIMKFMLEIVTTYQESNERLDKVYVQRSAPYTSEELDVVREQWAKFFTTKYLLV